MNSHAGSALTRPKRWDAPFDPNLHQIELGTLLRIPEIAAIDASAFPKSLPLEGILRNDCRFIHRQPGEIVIREGDYGSSAFLIVRGSAKAVLPPGVPLEQLGRRESKTKSRWQAFSQLWENSRQPEARDLSRYQKKEGGKAIKGRAEGLGTIFIDRQEASGPNLKDILPSLATRPLPQGSLFGEIAALRREPRSASVVADSNCLLLEIRWQGLRDIRKYDGGWRQIIDQSYRRNALFTHLSEHPLFANVNEHTLEKIARATLFENYGSFEWFNEFQRRGLDSHITDQEPLVAAEGEYSDGLLLIAAGFGRVTVKTGNGQRTVTYLRSGDCFGLEELLLNWETGQDPGYQSSLYATGYLDVLRVPGHALAEIVNDLKSLPHSNFSQLAAKPIDESDDLLEWAVNERFINGTQTMLIDLNSCVRCDDCVRACSRAHDGNPRFIRQGHVLDGYMVANACMHCNDPVCLIGCPTGAIHRTIEQGIVTINDDTCIGCGVCANSCPYNNIRLVEINDSRGRKIVDPDTSLPISKATKCDLCAEQRGGPACVRACPTNAMSRIDFRQLDQFAGR